MAFFKTKKDKNDTKDKTSVGISKKTEPKVAKETPVFLTENLAEAILRPRITEKATSLQQNSTYVFEVDPRSTKASIKKSFVKIYKIVPQKINIVKNPAKTLFVRGRVGRKPAVKKAYVYLKEGERIELV